jgi:hypothetical protein
MADKLISQLDAAAALSGTDLIEVEQGTTPSNTSGKVSLAALAAFLESQALTIVTEASVVTMDPATHAGRSKYIRAADDVTFNTSEGYTAGEVYNIRATAGLTLVGTGVTLTPPAGGTLDLDAAMSVSVIMTSSSAGDVIGQTVPA